MISAFVSPANLQDRDGLKQVLNQYFDSGLTRLRKLWVDGGYRGEDLKEWVANKKQTHKIDLEVVTHTGKGFQVVKRGGSLSAPLRGYAIFADCQRIMKA